MQTFFYFKVFSMNSSTGIVSLVNLHGFDQTSSYLLNISVSDGVHASTTKLRVNLVSANSFTPTFDKNVYEVNFAENQAKGVQVLFILVEKFKLLKNTFLIFLINLK